jgi:hypothetical protein
VAGSYGGPRRLPDAAELISVIVLAIMAVWGAWFCVQSLLALWWPLNLAYGLAGAMVAIISAVVARAVLKR